MSTKLQTALCTMTVGMETVRFAGAACIRTRSNFLD